MTATSSPPAAATNPDIESTRAFLVRGGVLVLAGWLVGDVIGALVAAAGVAATWRRPVGIVAGGAAVMLAAAGLATVLEVVPEEGSLRSNFATSRPTAAACGLAAGVLALVAVVTIAARERAPAPSAPATVDAGWRDPARRAELAARLRRLAPAAGLVLAVMVLRLALAPDPLDDAELELTRNVRSGAGYVLGQPGDYTATADHTPVPVLVAAFGPGGERVALVAASGLAVALAVALATRITTRRAGLLAGAGTVVVLVAAMPRLPATLAAALLLLAALLGAPPSRPSVPVALAGVAFGLAVLSVPLLILASPLFVGWIAFGLSAERPGSVSGAVLATATAALTGLPWALWVHDRFGTWAPSTDMGFTPEVVVALLPLAAVAVACVVARRAGDSPDLEPHPETTSA